MATTLTVTDPTATCACGQPMTAHRCPTSTNTNPFGSRSVVTRMCPRCGYKDHQNLDSVTVELECLWRQFCRDTGNVEVKYSASGAQRVLLARQTPALAQDYAQWINGQNGATGAGPALNPDGTIAPPVTAAVRSRMEAAAAKAAALPGETITAADDAHMTPPAVDSVDSDAPSPQDGPTDEQIVNDALDAAIGTADQGDAAPEGWAAISLASDLDSAAPVPTADAAAFDLFDW